MKSVDFVISRLFAAPRELVWKAFTEPERIERWWPPNGAAIVAATMDLRPGGTYHCGMRSPDGHVTWGRFVYREIAAPERLVSVNSFSDEAGGITRHPAIANWPLEMLSTVTFEQQQDGNTEVTIRWSPIDCSDEEQRTFDAGHYGMRYGWGGTLDQLAAYLASAK